MTDNDSFNRPKNQIPPKNKLLEKKPFDWFSNHFIFISIYKIDGTNSILIFTFVKC